MTKTHGMRGTTEYKSWAAMIQRCCNSKDMDYNSYGGRGITVCERWRTSFANFYADMGKKPNARMSIDRINNDGNYEPSNCRWATPSQQANNKRPYKETTEVYSNNTTGVTGVSIDRTTGKYQARTRVNGVSIHLGRFSTIDQAKEAIEKKKGK